MPNRENPIFVVDQTNNRYEIRGKLPDYYYYFSASVTNLYFFKSNTPYKKDAVPMNRDEIECLFHEIIRYVNGNNIAIIKTIETYCREQWKKEDAVAKTEQIFKPVRIAAKRMNNDKELQRKEAQRDKILNQYVTIPPVVITDGAKTPVAVCAKQNNQIIYISLNEVKPEFWCLSIVEAKPMGIEDFAQFIDLLMKSPKAEKACENIALLFKKFMLSEQTRISPNYANKLYTESRIALAKGLNSFTSVERAFCEQLKEHSR